MSLKVRNIHPKSSADILSVTCFNWSCLQLCGGKHSEGVFVGAFLSMSSTAVVISKNSIMLI